MKKILISVCFFITLLCSPLTFAGGGIAHMLIAKEAIAKLPDPALRILLLTNLDAYLVGAYYPDSGFVAGNQYGEDSHWDTFIETFANYIKEKYKNPANENPKLVAFLFGCASHRVSDEVTHWVFYPLIKKHDFAKETITTRKVGGSYGDLGIDLLSTVDKNQ